MNGHGHARYVCGRGKRRYQDIAQPHVKRRVPARWIEPVVWDAIERALRNPALIAAALEGRRNATQTDEAALDRDRQGYLRQIAQCDKDVTRWEVAFVAEAIDVDDFKAKKAEIATRRTSAEKELALLDEQDHPYEQAHLETDAIEAYCAHVRAGLVFDLAEKRRAFEALNITVIWHHDGLPEIRGACHEDLSVSRGVLLKPFNSMNAWTPEQRLADMNSLGVDIQVVSTNVSFYKYDQDIATTTAIARACNNEVHQMTVDYPGALRWPGYPADARHQGSHCRTGTVCGPARPQRRHDQ